MNKQELSEELDKARELKHVFKALVESPAWAKLKEVAKGQIEIRKNAYWQESLGSIDSILAAKKMKDESNGIQIFLSLPETVIENAAKDIEDLVNEIEHFDDRTEPGVP